MQIVRELRDMGAVTVKVGEVAADFGSPKASNEPPHRHPVGPTEPDMLMKTGNDETDAALARRFQGVL